MNIVERYNVELRPLMKGRDYSVTLRLKKKDGAPISAEGRVFQLAVKHSPHQSDDEAVIFVVEEPTGTDAEEGWVTLVVPYADSVDIPATRYHFDVVMYAPGLSKQSLMQGRLPVVQTVSHTVEAP